MKKNNRRPATAGAIIDATFGRLHLTKKLKQYESFEFWPEIVGEGLAKISYPEQILSNKILVVRVIDAAWIQELAFKKEEILEKFRNKCKNIYFEDIRFISGNPKDFNNKRM